MKNKERFVATEASLSFSETIAKELGIPFDKETTKEQAHELLDLYFQDISLVLPDETRDCHFENFATRNFLAFSGHIKNMPLINIDQQWPMFLMDANVLVCIRACTVPDTARKHQTAALFKENLATITAPNSHEVLREKMKPLILEHIDLLPLVNLLTTCMFGFMLCHELAHHNLEHLNKIQDKELELEADAKGFEYLTRVSAQFEQLQFLKIPPNMLSAPIIAMYYLYGLEKIGVMSTENNSHPSSMQRIQNLYALFNKVADDEAHYLYNGLKMGCEELIDEINVTNEN